MIETKRLLLREYAPDDFDALYDDGLAPFRDKTVYDAPIRPSQEELDGGRFWTPQEIAQSMGKGIFTPNFEDEYRRFFGEALATS